MTTETQTPTTPNKPTHHAYQVRDRDRDGEKGFWTRIGSAWAHKDGQGFSLHLDALPVDGRLSLRVATEKKG